MFDKSTSYMLSVAASIYGVLAYTIAFSLEIWFIFNSDNLEETASFTNKNHHHHEQQTFIIPMTALVQASIYFVLVILSLFLVLGVIIKSIVCLLCWIIGVLLAFLPECALVIYTCLNVWKIETRNGQIELCFFVFRFIMNTFFVIFVYNLIKQWKTDKMMSSYMSSRDAFSAYPHITTLRLTKNPTFLTKNHNSNFDTFTNQYNQSSMSLNDLNKLKSLNIKSFYEAAGYPYYAYFPEDYDAYLRRADQAFPSEFDTNSFRRYKMIRKPIDMDLNEQKLIDELNLKDQYFQNNKGAPVNENDSINNSINLEHNNQTYNQLNNHQMNNHHQSTNQFNNQLNNQFNNNVILRPLNTRPFDYLNRPGSVMNLTRPFESDEIDLNHNLNNKINEKKDLKKTISQMEKKSSSLRDVAL